MNTKKTKIIFISILGLLVVGIILFFTFHKKNEVMTTFDTQIIQRGNLSKTVTATGTVEPVSTVDVGTQVSGNISKLYVDYNSVVKKGQLIAEVDRTNLLSELHAQENSLASAQNDLDYQKKNHERAKSLHDQHLLSEAEYEEAEYKYKSALYTYNRAKESVTTAKTNLGYSYIYSPIDGVILSKSVEEGQTVAASFSTPTLFTIANDLTKMRVVADVDEADIGQVKEGMNVEFSVDAYPDEIFNGTVTQIRLEAQVNSNVVTYEVVIDAPNPDLKLMPGLTANVSIYTVKIDDVLLLPTKALKYSPSGKVASNNLQEIWLLKQGKPCKKQIKVGNTDGIYYQVLDGLKERDVVIVGEKEMTPSNHLEKVTDADNAKQSPFMPGPPGSHKK